MSHCGAALLVVTTLLSQPGDSNVPNTGDAAVENPAVEEVRQPKPQPATERDVANADYFELVQRELGLGAADVAKLSENDFILIEPESEQSFPSAYYRLYARDLPLLITTDSILHAFHHSYDKILLELESGYLAGRLDLVLSGCHEALAEDVADSVPPELNASYRDVDLYLAVARNLLAGSEAGELTIPTVMGQDAQARVLIGGINSANNAGVTPTALHGDRRRIDFTQFRPRGHYTKTPALQRYFRSMMWLGRADCGWDVSQTASASGSVTEDVRELQGTAILVQLLSSSGCLQVWQRTEDLLSFMVGKPDNLGVTDVLQALEESEIEATEDLLDVAKLHRLQNALQRSVSSEQRIRSQVLFKSADSTQPAKPPIVFQFFGQRFVLDSQILSEVVYDSIPARRMMPTGLDVMAGLGNDLATRLLEPELGRWDYGEQLASLRASVDDLPKTYWRNHVYGGWLEALRCLDRDLTGQASLPRIFRSEAWQRKQLQTQLASWSELRHDTVLYAKASYSVPDCEVPLAYVEPYPEFFDGLARLSRLAADRLGTVPPMRKPVRRGLFGARELSRDDSYSEFFRRMARHMDTLRDIAQKEVNGDPLSDEEIGFLQKTISQKGNVLFGSGALEVKTYDGWYTQLMYSYGEEEQDTWKATIADVHTDPQGHQVLEVGVGKVGFCVAAISLADQSCIFAGPVYSYYEFSQPTDRRLTDSEWQVKLRHNPPSRLPFIQPLLGGRGARLEPIVEVRRDADRLDVVVDERSQDAGVPGTYRIKITSDGLRKLTRVAPGLRYLDVSGCPVADADLKTLEPLYNLKAVDFSDTDIKGDGLQYLSRSRFLRRLVLRNTAIDDNAMKWIGNWPYLENLDLRGTNVSDEGLKQLAANRYLRRLMVEDTQVTSAGVAAIRDVLTSCEVSSAHGLRAP